MLLLIRLQKLLLCIEVGHVGEERGSNFAFWILGGLDELLDHVGHQVRLVYFQLFAEAPNEGGGP